jgi:hypothetical protein
MKTIISRISEIEERLTNLGGGNELVTAYYHNDGEEPFKIISQPCEKNIRVNVLCGQGYVPASLYTDA